MYKAKTMTELNEISADILEHIIELHDLGKLSDDGLAEALYILQEEYKIMRRYITND